LDKTWISASRNSISETSDNVLLDALNQRAVEFSLTTRNVWSGVSKTELWDVKWRLCSCIQVTFCLRRLCSDADFLL